MKNLLLIDDEEELCQSMKELFEDSTMLIHVAYNGVEALKVLDEMNIDCIVSDIKMPVMDGIKFMKESREKGYQGPIIFFTGHGTEQMKKEVGLLGADLYFKPNFLMLELAIRKHMTSSEI
jgi:DNA-binding response OmpR family regulator